MISTTNSCGKDVPGCCSGSGVSSPSARRGGFALLNAYERFSLRPEACFSDLTRGIRDVLFGLTDSDVSGLRELIEPVRGTKYLRTIDRLKQKSQTGFKVPASRKDQATSMEVDVTRTGMGAKRPPSTRNVRMQTDMYPNS